MTLRAYYLGLTQTAATLAEHGGGAATGDLRYDSRGRQYILVKSTAVALADGVICKSASGATVTSAAADLTVNLSTAVTDQIVCVNNTGASITASHYWWGLQKGRGYCVAGVDVDADGLALTIHTTDGACTAAASPAATNSHLGICITDLDLEAPLVNAVIWDLPSKSA